MAEIIEGSCMRPAAEVRVRCVLDDPERRRRGVVYASGAALIDDLPERVARLARARASDRRPGVGVTRPPSAAIGRRCSST